MQPITDVVREFQSINGAVFLSHTSPFEGPPRRIYELPAGLSFDSDEDLEYPGWVQGQVWRWDKETRRAND